MVEVRTDHECAACRCGIFHGAGRRRDVATRIHRTLRAVNLPS